MQEKTKAAVQATRRQRVTDDKAIILPGQDFCKSELTALHKKFDEILLTTFEANSDGRPLCPKCGSMIVADAAGDCLCRCGTSTVARRLASNKQAAKQARLASKQGRRICKEMGWAA